MNPVVDAAGRDRSAIDDNLAAFVRDVKFGALLRRGLERSILVAIAAYAAAAISGGPQVGAVVAGSYSCVMFFSIPFSLAYDPLIRAVPESGAVSGGGPYLLLVAKLCVAMYLFGSALVHIDKHALGWPKVLLRLVAAVRARPLQQLRQRGVHHYPAGPAPLEASKHRPEGGGRGIPRPVRTPLKDLEP